MMVLMENTIIYLALILTGLCLGSFAGAMVWRLRARELVEAKKDGQDYDQAEYKRLKKLTVGGTANDRSRCLHCSYVLRWYDLIPLISWLSLSGRCRQCHTRIGYLEPLIELGTTLFFVLSFAFWPYPLLSTLDITRLIIWLLSGVGLAILFAYDTKWYELPDKINFGIIGLGTLNVAVVMFQPGEIIPKLISIAGAILILSGIYWVLYKVSHGQWIGFGDIKLGLGLALLLADWRLAFIALFAANLIGCIVVIPAMISHKLKPSSHVPFGPLFILGFVVAQLAGPGLIETYFSSVF